MIYKAILDAMKADIHASVNYNFAKDAEMGECDNESWSSWLSQIDSCTTFKELMAVFEQWDEELGASNFAQLMDELLGPAS